MAKSFTVLVVEDDPEWREPLCEMYKNILSSLSPIILSATSGQDALRLIRTRNNRYDLISIDINLGLTHQKKNNIPDITIPGADGRVILRMSCEMDACNGVIVITAAPHDKTLDVIIPNDEDRSSVQTSLHVYLDELFPGRNLYFIKDLKKTVDENVKIYKKHLTAKRISDLCKSTSKLPPPYRIERTEHGNVLIKSKSDEKAFVSIINDNDKVFIELLCEMNKYHPYYVEKLSVLGIYNKKQIKDIIKAKAKANLSTDEEYKTIVENNKEIAQGVGRAAGSYINSLKRRLREQGIDPDSLLSVVRGKGWKLHQDISLKGFASVDKRSSGLGQKYGRQIDINDLPDNI